MTEQQEKYTELEKEAQKWLDETDTMQFSQMELLTMFAGHQQVKNNALLNDVIERFSNEGLMKFQKHFVSLYGSDEMAQEKANSFAVGFGKCSELMTNALKMLL